MEASKIKTSVFLNSRKIEELLKTRQETRIGSQTAMQCAVCWYVYDPAAGDEMAAVPPGTPFLALPAGWTCPQCGTAPERFLVVNEALHHA